MRSRETLLWSRPSAVPHIINDGSMRSLAGRLSTVVLTSFADGFVSVTGETRQCARRARSRRPTSAVVERSFPGPCRSFFILDCFLTHQLRVSFFFVFCSFARGRVLPLSPVPVQRPLEAIYKTIFVSSVFVASFFKVLKSARLNHILCSEGFCLECKYVTDSRASLMHLNLRQMHSQRKRKTSCLEP